MMYTFKISFFAGILALFMACNNDTPSNTDQSKSGDNQEPVSQQAAELQTMSKEALNKTKSDIIAGNQPMTSNNVKASLVTEPMVAQGGSESKPTAVKAQEPQTIKKEKPLPVTNNSASGGTKEVKVSNPPLPAPTNNQSATQSQTTTSQPLDNNTTTKPAMPSGQEAPKHQSEEKKEMKVDHTAFDALLRKHVSSKGKVNYKGIKSEQKKLDDYLAHLSAHPVQSDWSRNEKMAYWINVYNAFTIKLIVDNYPVKSITDLEGGKPWDKRWIKIGEKTYSLNQVENEILRPQFKEPAIHFAVNCAAKSCPPLLNQAWTADNLKTNFKKQATAFINNPTYNQISANNAKVSKIFDWYKEDFGNLVDYLNIYSTTQLSKGASISFLEYDWSLNE